MEILPAWIRQWQFAQMRMHFSISSTSLLWESRPGNPPIQNFFFFGSKWWNWRQSTRRSEQIGQEDNFLRLVMKTRLALLLLRASVCRWVFFLFVNQQEHPGGENSFWALLQEIGFANNTQISGIANCERGMGWGLSKKAAYPPKVLAEGFLVDRREELGIGEALINFFQWIGDFR